MHQTDDFKTLWQQASTARPLSLPCVSLLLMAGLTCLHALFFIFVIFLLCHMVPAGVFSPRLPLRLKGCQVRENKHGVPSNFLQTLPKRDKRKITSNTHTSRGKKHGSLRPPLHRGDLHTNIPRHGQHGPDTAQHINLQCYYLHVPREPLFRSQ